MFIKTITYKDFTGNERTETLHFNLNEAELMEMQVKYPGGYGAYLQNVINSNNQALLFAEFKSLILASYGIRSEDGRNFHKSAEISDSFLTAAVYPDFFKSIISDEKAASEFINGLMPPEVVQRMAQEQGKVPTAPQDYLPAQPQAASQQVPAPTQESNINVAPVQPPMPQTPQYPAGPNPYPQQ